MRRRCSQLAVPFLLTLALALLAPTVTARAAEPVGTTVEFSPPPEGAVGEELVAEARLTDEAGTPIVDAEVVFQREVEFLRAGGGLELGRGVTDRQGLARVSFVPRSEGEVPITARFSGNARYAPVSGEIIVTIRTGPALYSEEAGVRVPGINVSLLVGILGGVWGTYFFVMLLIWRIASEGRTPAPASEQPHE